MTDDNLADRIEALEAKANERFQNAEELFAAERALQDALRAAVPEILAALRAEPPDDVAELVKRLRHCSAITPNEYLHELSGRSADILTTQAQRIAELEAENARLKPDNRYPFVYHDRETWGKIGVSFARRTDFVRVDMLMENKPGGAWRVVDMTPDEAEQMGLRLIERAQAARAALKGTTNDQT